MKIDAPSQIALVEALRHEAFARPGQEFFGVWRRWRVGLSVMAVGLLGMAVAHAADEGEEASEPLAKENAELARKYPAVAGVSRAVGGPGIPK